MATSMAVLNAQVWALKTLAAGGASVASACYVQRACAHLKPGSARLSVIAPILLQFSLTPFIFSMQHELLSRAFSCAILLWLANFKLLLFALNRGPLSDTSLRLDQFVALLLWPLLHKQGPDGRVQRWTPAQSTDNNNTPSASQQPASTDNNTKNSSDSSRDADTEPRRRRAALQRLFLRVPENLIITLIGSYTLTHPRVPIFLKTYSAAFSVSCFCDLFANAAAALVIYCNGLDIALSWNRPWLQNCLSDFWSRRWNLAAAYSLRALVFEPLMEGRAVRKPGDNNNKTSKDNNTTTHRAKATGAANGIPAGDLAPAEAPSEVPNGQHTTDANGTSGALNGKADSYAAAVKRDTGVAAETKPDSTQVLNGHAPMPRSRRGTGAPASRRIIALAAAFAVSGAMHELLLWVCTGWAAYRRVAGWQMLYFLLQVPTSIIEQILHKSFKRAKWSPPEYIAIPFTSLSLQIPGLFLFWNPIFNAATWAMQGSTA